MDLIHRLIAGYRRGHFHPTILAIFSNPLYFVRKGIADGIRKNAYHMRGIMLDFGCGSKPYREFFSVDRYVGVEIARDSGEHPSGVADVFYDGRRIPFRDESFDSALSSEVLEHLFNMDEILDELYRVMKQGAVLLVTVPFVWNEHESPHDFGRYTSFGIRHSLQRHGFEVLHLEKSTTFVETVVQMWNCYIAESLLPQRGFLRVLLIPVLVSPWTLAGILASRVLPANGSFYHNNIVVARKPGGDAGHRT